MSKKELLLKQTNKFLYKHLWLKISLEYIFAFIVSALSAFLFAFGMKAFLKPDVVYEGLKVVGNSAEVGEIVIINFVSGGASGLSQTIAKIFELINSNFAQYSDLIYSICYIAINIPLFFLAYSGVGKRFAILTIINVVMVSLFVNFLPWNVITRDISIFVDTHGGMLARALFAGVTTGLSSALAFKLFFSAGGVDVVSYYLSNKKSTSVGKYNTIMNAIIVILYVVFDALSIGTSEAWSSSFGGAFFTLIYLLTTMLIVDLINVRNKKVQLQIITSTKDLPELLMTSIPHGATVIKGYGAYSGEEKYIIYMDVGQTETKKVVNLVKRIDPNSFVNVCSLQQVFGRFFAKSIK